MRITGNIWGFPKIRGTILGVPIIRTIIFWGSMLGSPYFGKLPYTLAGPKMLNSLCSTDPQTLDLSIMLENSR